MAAANQPINTFIKRLNVFADVPDEIDHEFCGSVAKVREFNANHDIVSQGDKPSHCCVILEGWIARNKILEGGRRQITALHFSGATPDLQSLFMPSLDHNITTLTTARVGFIPHASLRQLMERFPSLVQAFWRETLVDAAISREWEVNLGARPASNRIAHVFCEMGTRLEWFGRANRSGKTLSFAWPLTQSQLAEATGLTNVHVNRCLQELRGSGLVEMTRERVTLLDVQKLAAFAGFNPDYLAAEEPRYRACQNQPM